MVCVSSGAVLPSTASHRTGRKCSTTWQPRKRFGDHAACPITTGDDLASDRCRRAGRVDVRQRHTVVVLIDRRHLRAEADVAIDRDQLVAQPGDQFVLRVDVVRPPAGQRAVVEHHAVVRSAELAAVVRRLEIQDGAGDTDRLQQLDGAVVDGTCLGHAFHVGPRPTFEHHERDALPMQQVGGDEACRPGTHDGDRGGSLVDRDHSARVQRPPSPQFRGRDSGTRTAHSAPEEPVWARSRNSHCSQRARWVRPRGDGTSPRFGQRRVSCSWSVTKGADDGFARCERAGVMGSRSAEQARGTTVGRGVQRDQRGRLRLVRVGSGRLPAR